MPPADILNYLAAFRGFKVSERKATEHAAAVNLAAEELKDWRKAAETSLFNPSLPRNTIPSASEIGGALSAWVMARDYLVESWRKLSDEERIGLMPPPAKE